MPCSSTEAVNQSMGLGCFVTRLNIKDKFYRARYNERIDTDRFTLMSESI